MDSTVVVIVDKIGAGLSALAVKLEAPAEHVYSLLVKQAALEGLVGLITIGGLIIISLSMFVAFVASITVDRIYKAGDWLPPTLISINIVLIIITFVFTILGGPYYYLKTQNPEYYAVKQIMELVK